MKKDIYLLLSIGLCLSMVNIQSGQKSKISPKQLAFATGVVTLVIVYYKKFAASPNFAPELPRDATRLEKLCHYLYHEVIGYKGGKKFSKTRSGDYRESRVPAKGLGWFYSECADFSKIVSIPATLLGLERFINILMAKN